MSKNENEVRLNVKMDKALLQALKRAAFKRGLTVSALTRLLLIDYLEQKKNEQQIITNQG